MTGEEIVAVARGWIGTPFHHQGRLKGVGVDCVGLVIGVAKELHILPDDFQTTAYRREPDGVTLIHECDRLLDRVSRDNISIGDILVMSWKTEPQHVGIIGDYKHGGFSLIHAFGRPGGGKVVEMRLDMNDLMRGGKFVAAYRFPGVE
jgi:cell wall-associated NlpC family hydrolase